MPDTSIEKNFLYLILCSILLHAVVFILLLNMPQEQAVPKTEPLMVDLDSIPTLSPPEPPAPPVERQAEQRRRVEQEIAPKGNDVREKSARLPQAARRAAPSAALPEKAPQQPPAPAPDSAARVRTPRDELFRKKTPDKTPELANLYPSAARLAKLEETYRKKYGPEVADGETRFLNADDIQFGSFLRRFENSVYGVWRYPSEAAMMGIEGITPVKITFNRQGKIVGREVLQSSGSRILDAEVLRTLDKVGPIGGFPKGYAKETFNLIAFFHYGISQGASRSLR